jgi:hypothetical protein
MEGYLPNEYKVFQTRKLCYGVDIQHVTGYAEPQFRVQTCQFSTHRMNCSPIKRRNYFFAIQKLISGLQMRL